VEFLVFLFPFRLSTLSLRCVLHSVTASNCDRYPLDLSLSQSHVTYLNMLSSGLQFLQIVLQGSVNEPTGNVNL